MYNRVLRFFFFFYLQVQTSDSLNQGKKKQTKKTGFQVELQENYTTKRQF